MIALLTGRLAYKSPDYVIIDVHGVGYRVHIPFSTYYELPEEGMDLSLNIHTHVKEDAIQLYGFLTRGEKSMFQLLISVSGIGPKLGNNILSNIQAAELSKALVQGDLGRLSAIPGIGRKTAERLVLELKEKVKMLADAGHATAAAPPSSPPDITDDVVSALINLGYKEVLVKKALSELKTSPADTVETVLKQALKVLMK